MNHSRQDGGGCEISRTGCTCGTCGVVGEEEDVDDDDDEEEEEEEEEEGRQILLSVRELDCRTVVVVDGEEETWPLLVRGPFATICGADDEDDGIPPLLLLVLLLLLCVLLLLLLFHITAEVVFFRFRAAFNTVPLLFLPTTTLTF